MTHDSCIFIERACLKESSESVGRRARAAGKAGDVRRKRGEEKSVVVCEVGKNV